MIWEPPLEFIERTNVWKFMQRLGFASREAFLAFSRDEPERFWREIMWEMGVEWFEPYTKVLDSNRGPEWTNWFLGGRLNIAHNCLDRWDSSDRVACVWEGENGASRKVTFSDLRAEANRVANGLRALGLREGDRAAMCMPMVPEVISILYGCLKAGLVVVPIFAGLGSGAIDTRLQDSGAGVLFTASHLERRGQRLPLLEKIPPGVPHTIVMNHEGGAAASQIPWGEFIRAQPAECDTVSLDAEARALILYTSGTTGKPKGTIHTHAGVLAQTGKEIWLGFDHKADDLFFWLSDIGWMMGPWTIIGNHLFGGTIFMYDGAPDYPGPHRLWEMVECTASPPWAFRPPQSACWRKRMAICRP
jgi:acetyl-CoA synthetase